MPFIKKYSKYPNLYFLISFFIKNFKSLFILLTLLLLILILIRNYSLFPSVMGDEFIHILNTKTTDFNNIKIYSPLYYFLYKSAFVCEDEFINCARYINLFFFIFANFIFFLLCRKFSNNKIAQYIFLILLLSPYNIYTAFFTPEICYFFFILLLIYKILSLNLKIQHFFLIGLLCALSSLVKPHAIFLLPSLVIYFFFLNKLTFLKITIFLISFFIPKIILHFFFQIEFSLFGEYYSSAGFNYLKIDFFHYLKIFKYMMINLFGIINFLIIAFGIPLILTINNVYVYFKAKNTTFRLAFFTFIVILSLIFVFSFFVSISANYNENNIFYESPFRLNNRYYFFALPLLFVVLAHNLKNFKKLIFNNNLTKYVCIIFFISALIFSFYKYDNFHLVDAPLYRGLVYNNFFYTFLIFFVLFMIILFNYKKLLSIKIYTFIFLPIIIISSSIPVNKEILIHKNPSASSLIGIKLKNYFINKRQEKYLIINVNDKHEQKLDEFKILTAFDKQYVGIITVNDQSLDSLNVTTNLIENFSKKNLLWNYSNNADYNYFILVLNKTIKEIYYLDIQSNKLKKIN